jgi:hypothetical protein
MEGTDGEGQKRGKGSIDAVADGFFQPAYLDLPGQAILADPAASTMRFRYNTIANRIASYIRPKFNNFSGKLMANDNWRIVGEAIVPDMYISATDSSRLHTDKDIPWSNSRLRNFSYFKETFSLLGFDKSFHPGQSPIASGCIYVPPETLGLCWCTKYDTVNLNFRSCQAKF